MGSTVNRSAVAAAVAALLAFPSLVFAQVKEKHRLEACREVLTELLAGRESIPRDLLDKAECVAVIPSAKKLAIGVGGRYGKGAVVCRGARGWSAPLMMTIGGGSFGLQIGGQAADYVFLVMNPKGIDYLMRSKFTLGADAAVAAGPVGRTGSADTDLRLKAEILSYSRTRGLFAGLSLEGAVVKQDRDANENVYGRAVDPHRLLAEGAYEPPAWAKGLAEVLTGASPGRPEPR
ncbi:MAG: lipid-binding SYLF domain-containing protein [Vicinamibacteria bacterium]